MILESYWKLVLIIPKWVQNASLPSSNDRDSTKRHIAGRFSKIQSQQLLMSSQLKESFRHWDPIRLILSSTAVANLTRSFNAGKWHLNSRIGKSHVSKQQISDWREPQLIPPSHPIYVAHPGTFHSKKIIDRLREWEREISKATNWKTRTQSPSFFKTLIGCHVSDSGE